MRGPKNNNRLPKPSANGHSSVLDAARQYLDLGLPITACRDKIPVLKGWPDRRLGTDDLDAAFGGSNNVAVVLNQCNLIDVECDTAEAETALNDMFDGEIPPTPTWRSARGLHRLFRKPAELPEQAVIELDGVEFRVGNQKGAVSLLPPSVTDGVEREWLEGLSLDELEPAELPEHIVDRLRSEKPPASDADEGGPANKGKRNDTLFKRACQLRDLKLPEETIVHTLIDLNKRICKPPLPAAEISGIIKSAFSKRSQSTKEKPSKPTFAELLTAIALDESEFWHTPEGVAYATVKIGGHREHWRVKSAEYREWLTRAVWEKEGKAPGTQTVSDVVNLLAGKARFDGQAHKVFVRVASEDGRVYIDLCDPAWRAVEIDQEGWRIVDEPPVRFHRAKGMLPLPVPTSGGSVKELQRFVNVTSRQWPLFLGWQIGAFKPTGPYPILKLLGEQGSAKTTTAEIARKNIDPNSALLRRAPKSDRDLMIAASNGWVAAFDNLSYVNPELSDALCCLATGASLATRKLYSDDDETILTAERPIILNGIEEMASRSDLLDRCVILELPRIDPDKRRDEETFWAEFAEAQPKIFGALLSAASAALKNLRKTKATMKSRPRLADFAIWVVAAERDLGLSPGTFLAAYAENRRDANQAALESSKIISALMTLLKAKPFKGTATKLLNQLQIGQDAMTVRAKSWPKDARALSGILNRLAPNLRAQGYTIEQARDGNEKTWDLAAPKGASANTQSTQKIVPKLKPTVATKRHGGS